jgi:D-glycero-D-manno-heptose 1,7-bisphosphate phosphatase
MHAYAFLDRDGTLIAECPDEAWRDRTEADLLPGVAEALRCLLENDFHLVIVTNQYLIGEGFISESDYRALTEKLVAHLGVAGVVLTDVLHCPHVRWVQCGCRKPATGMVRTALERHGPMDRLRSFVVGDSDCDMQLAQKLGLRGFHIVNGALDSFAPVGSTPITGLASLPAALGLSC